MGNATLAFPWRGDLPESVNKNKRLGPLEIVTLSFVPRSLINCISSGQLSDLLFPPRALITSLENGLITFCYFLRCCGSWSMEDHQALEELCENLQSTGGSDS